MASSTRPTTLNVNLDDLAKMIDHSLLHPTMTDEDVLAGLQISKEYGVATGKTPQLPSLLKSSSINLHP
jgi:deoxyribose-phosphate aldolase